MAGIDLAVVGYIPTLVRFVRHDVPLYLQVGGLYLLILFPLNFAFAAVYFALAAREDRRMNAASTSKSPDCQAGPTSR